MPSIWTAEQINRYTLQAEELFCDEFKVIIERYALNIEEDEDFYSLPDNTLDIRRITYKGLRLIPISHRNSRSFFEGLSSTGEPRWYIYNNLGAGAIRLFPIPNENIIADQTNLFDPAAIAVQCIVEYYSMPDGISIKLPEYLRRRLLKAYVLSQCFLAEGKGQNLKAAAYWQQKWEYLKEVYGNQLYELITSARKLMVPAIDIQKYMPPTAQLPIRMQATGVDPGE